MGDAIRFVLTNLPAILFVAALIIPSISRSGPPGRRYLGWLLLLSVGFDMIWAGFFHVFFPATAAAEIGWQVSPFQFEVGVSDLAIGITAVIAFWRSFAFQAAVTIYVILFYLGVAIGHVRQAVTAQDFAPDNFGVLLLITVAKVVLLAGLLWQAHREASLAAPRQKGRGAPAV